MKSVLKAYLYYIKVIALFLLLPATAQAQADSLRAQRKPFFPRLLNGITEFFMGCDTNYITPQKYQFTTQAELSYWHDFYRLRSSETGNTMTIQSVPSVVLGGYIYYSILGYGISWNLGDIGKPKGQTNGTSMRQGLVLNTAKIFAEVYTYTSGKSARITQLTNFNFKGYDRSFTGLNSKVFGLQAFYIFNNRHFSWPAAYGENAVQRRSCGSWNLGFQYNHQTVTFNDEELPDYLKPTMDPTLLFNRVDYNDYSVSIGYSFNWVPRRNLLLAISLQPSVGYRCSNIEEANQKHNILNNVSTDLTTRASVVWNNTKMFSGLILELHTYSYRREKFGLTNTYGTLKLVVGFNFLRKKQ
ncbi:MAG: DUF4421 domain-containing protein [Bacteroidaceae bacterium]|nr:DUF4421 domain-containing protein [Bacteroidaceae bacterium]